MKKRGIVAGIIAALIVLDQLVKAYVVQNIALGEIKSWIPNLVSLTYLQNRGAAFSMLDRLVCGAGEAMVSGVEAIKTKLGQLHPFFSS